MGEALVRHCAFLTLEDGTGYVMGDDELAVEPLRELGWDVKFVPWSRPRVTWNAYEVVVIRSTWDYAKAPDAFLSVLSEIERSGAQLVNGLHLVRWNIQKTYLRDLAERGVPVVPTVWRARLEAGELRDLIAEVGAPEAVIKPVVGASAEGVYRVDERTVREQASAVEAYYADRALMAQPFVRAVSTEGEYSLFYFNGQYSHAILKTPATTDFRVQEEYGGLIRAVQPDRHLRTAGDTVLDALRQTPLYVRADFVRNNDCTGFLLMELELIEPCLYFRMDKGAPVRFAYALDAWATGRYAMTARREP